MSKPHLQHLPGNAGGPALLLLICVLLQLAQSIQPDWFFYGRALLAEGQWWRLLSGHLVHTNTAHLLLNGGAVVALWLVFGQGELFGQKHPISAYLGLVVLLSVLISLGLWLWFPDVEIYYGLSGVLHGLFCFGAMSDLAVRRWSGALLLAGCFAKLAFEWIVGPSEVTATLIEAEVAVSGHLLGSVLGTFLFAVLWCLSSRRIR